jgi:hypothetical protein
VLLLQSFNLKLYTMPGISNFYLAAPAVVVNNSSTLVPLGLQQSIAAAQSIYIRAVIPVSKSGTTAGLRIAVQAPAGSAGELTYKIVDPGSPDITPVIVSVSTDVTNGLGGGAGNYTVEVEGVITAGSTAGAISVEVAQLSPVLFDLTFGPNSTLQAVLL